MTMYIISKRAELIDERDIDRMLPPYIGSGYRDLNIIWQSNPDKGVTERLRRPIIDALRKRGVSVTLKSEMYTYSGEPRLIVELGE